MCSIIAPRKPHAASNEMIIFRLAFLISPSWWWWWLTHFRSHFPPRMKENSLVGGRAFLSIREALAEVSLVIVRGRSPCLYLNHRLRRLQRKFSLFFKEGGVAELRHTRFGANFSVVLCSWIISLWNCSRSSSEFMAFRNSPKRVTQFTTEALRGAFSSSRATPVRLCYFAVTVYVTHYQYTCLLIQPPSSAPYHTQSLTFVRDGISNNCGPTYSTLFRFHFDN